MSETFYHVDRWDELAAGETLDLEPLHEWEPEVDALLAERYPGGLSHHGRYYATRDLYDEDADGLWDFACEALFELVRLRQFPGLPSRFQSVFGFRTVRDAKAFLAEVDDSEGTIWAVTADRYFEGDMRLVDAPDFARGLHRAEYYWAGETFTDDPLWEALLVPPVEAVEPICDGN